MELVWNQFRERAHGCMLGAAARTVVNGDLCRGSCGRARAGDAALSATTTRAGRPPSRRAPAERCSGCVGSVCVPMSAQAPQPPLGVTGNEPPSMRLRLRSQSSCPTPVGRDHRRCPRGGALAAHGALVQRRSAWNEWAIHACSARRPSSTGSRFGTGMGAEQRAVRSGGAHPVNRSQLGRRLELAARRRPISVPICARFGHDPEPTIARGCLAGRGSIRVDVRPPRAAPRWGPELMALDPTDNPPPTLTKLNSPNNVEDEATHESGHPVQCVPRGGRHAKAARCDTFHGTSNMSESRARGMGFRARGQVPSLLG